MTTPMRLKNSLTYTREPHDYSCCVKQSYERHVKTKKTHFSNTTTDDNANDTEKF